MTKVNITRRVKIEGKGLQFCKIVYGAGGKIKPDWVIVNGLEEHHPEAGPYYLDFRQNGKRTRRAGGLTAAEATQAAEQQKALLLSHRAATKAGIRLPEPEVTGGRSLRDAVDTYLLEIEAHRKPKTHAAYSTALKYFLESTRKQTLEELIRTDMLSFMTHLRKNNQSARSVWNKFSNVMGFLKWAKINLGIGKNDWPKYTEEEVDNYSPKELDAFFHACDETETAWFKFFRFTAMREQEVMYSDWSNIDFERKVVTVRENKQFGWTPKEDKGREIPIPSELVDLLKAWKTKSDRTCGLVFPTAGCKPKLDFLDECKAIAKRAGLTGDFYLHKFRSTRTTEWARACSTDDAMRMSGHSDYESFKRYLGKQKIDVLQQQIEKMNTVGA
jgi:integrase/recombinase XerD